MDELYTCLDQLVMDAKGESHPGVFPARVTPARELLIELQSAMHS